MKEVINVGKGSKGARSNRLPAAPFPSWRDGVSSRELGKTLFLWDPVSISNS